MEYADVVTRAFGDRVKDWITHNEPWCTSILSHQIGLHAPSLQDWGKALAASHHVLLSHGLAVQVIRGNSVGAKVGITLNLTPAYAASPSPADKDACRHFDGHFNRWFLDPVHGRGYPGDIVADYIAMGHLPPEGFTVVKEGDLAAIAAPCDFLGINYYFRAILRSDKILDAQSLPRTVEMAPESEWTEMGWEQYPDGLNHVLNRVNLVYAPQSIYVTENGASFGTAPDGEGRVRDELRQGFLRDHFLASKRAIDAGVPLHGFFVWSLLDNFEWDRGYSQRFGIVWVDYETQQRIPKDSALWYKRVIAENAFDVP